MNIGILGDGGWGTALALVLHRNGHRVRIWGPFPDYVHEVATRRENPKFLPGVALPPDLLWTSDRELAVAGADSIVLAVPSRFYGRVASDFAPFLPPQALLISVSKGLDQETRLRLTEIAERRLGRGPVAALSGPSHAEEVARGIPTAVVAACPDHEVAAAVQRLFNNSAFRVYTSEDIVGVELGGALKNVIALAAGISDGIGYGDNTKAALITRGLAEMTRLGVARGARAETFAGLSGIGDLIVTCTSRLSRNRAVGERLGRGEPLSSILTGMEQVAEGIWTCRAAWELAQEMGVETPIIEQVVAVVHDRRDPREAVHALMSRPPRRESENFGVG
ncbi:MAG: NAD(P)-dependent glycerol-3-phosphate dehydrogenase [Kiritimatiellae bacterium]|nr:NAD(P)-dependent glycerol-3-phosphate dehydrogenase [Kiritimatiellia bacterium]MDW8457928.1 NAD(P)H-dependent glycerol-3-phosphate dehydrogenase [Verrucomicrobiota bacterium]